jgi:hypothetical protein
MDESIDLNTYTYEPLPTFLLHVQGGQGAGGHDGGAGDKNKRERDTAHIYHRH